MPVGRPGLAAILTGEELGGGSEVPFCPVILVYPIYWRSVTESYRRLGKSSRSELSIHSSHSDRIPVGSACAVCYVSSRRMDKLHRNRILVGS